MRVSRLAKSWNTLVAIRSKILSKLSSLLPPPLLPSFSALFIELVRIIWKDSSARYWKLSDSRSSGEKQFCGFAVFRKKKKKIGKIYKRKIYSTNEKSIFSLIS